MNSLAIKQFVQPFQRKGVFKGVFACDRLPTKFSLPGLFIINLSPSLQPGSHWVSLYIDSHRCALYFDSFGLQPYNSDILRFIKRNSNKVVYNKKQVQHLSSMKCGRFACAFAVSILKNIDLALFFARFSNNLKINDIVVENVYNYLDVMGKKIGIKKTNKRCMKF